MATNKLLEAAAEILASGKGKNAMPPEKLPAEIHDAGGPTPQNAKPDDDSHKITPSTKSATAPTTRSTKKEEVEEEMPVEADATPEVEVKQPKKVVSITEQHFAEMESKIAELETKLAAMTPEVVEEPIELTAEPKPIQFNPENSNPIEHIDLAANTGKSTRDRILEEVYNNK